MIKAVETRWQETSFNKETRTKSRNIRYCRISYQSGTGISMLWWHYQCIWILFRSVRKLNECITYCNIPKRTVQNTLILFVQSKYKNKQPWYLNSITFTSWMRVFMGISLVYTWCRLLLQSSQVAASWYCSWLLSTLTLHLAYKRINPEKYSLLKLLLALV